MIKTIIAFAALSAATAARADWQITKWGMNESELIALSENVRPTTSAEKQDHSNPHVGNALYKSGYSATDINFTAYYWFNAGRLVAVELVPVNLEQWPKANLTLEKVYGAPIEDKSYAMPGPLGCRVVDRKWRSEREKNAIKVFGMDCVKSSGRDFFSIRYEPILSTGSSGL